MHSLREVDIADSRVELQPLHDFEVHFVNHVPVRHGFLMSRQTRAILNDNRRLAPVKMVPAHFRAQTALCRGYSAGKRSIFRGKSARIGAIIAARKSCR